MKKILVTGASGFLGHHVLKLLSDDGFEIHAISSREGGFRKAGIDWHKCDIHDKASVVMLCKKIKANLLLHLAWVTTPGSYWESTENFKWVASSLVLAEEFIKNGGERIVSAGSCAEYDWRYGYCTEDLTPYRAKSSYATCKTSLSNMLRALATNNNITYAWARLFFLYGPFEKKERLVSSTITSLLKNNLVACKGGGLVRDYLYIEDAAYAFVSLLKSEIEGDFNIGSGKPVLIDELVMKIANKMDRNELIDINHDKNNSDVSLVVANTKRIHKAINWVPDYSLDKGLDLTIDWWKSNV